MRLLSSPEIKEYLRGIRNPTDGDTHKVKTNWFKEEVAEFVNDFFNVKLAFQQEKCLDVSAG